MSIIDPEGNRLYDRSAWIERMAWRTVCMTLFVLGLIMFVYSGGTYLYLALVVGGLVPGLFLMAREQSERHIEAQRHAMAPEGRHDELPPPPGGLSGPYRPELHAPVARGYRDDYPTAREPVPYGGLPYDDDDLDVSPPTRGVVRRPTELDPDSDDGRGGHPVTPH